MRLRGCWLEWNIRSSCSCICHDSWKTSSSNCHCTEGGAVEYSAPGSGGKYCFGQCGYHRKLVKNQCVLYENAKLDGPISGGLGMSILSVLIWYRKSSHDHQTLVNEHQNLQQIKSHFCRRRRSPLLKSTSWSFSRGSKKVEGTEWKNSADTYRRLIGCKL